MFEAIDVDGSGTIEITEFVAACLVKRQINDAAIKAAFSRLDFTRCERRPSFSWYPHQLDLRGRVYSVCAWP